MKKLLVDLLLKAILSSEWRGRLIACVKALEDDAMSGDQKRAAVRQSLTDAGLALAGFVLNLAIELAVARLRGI